MERFWRGTGRRKTAVAQVMLSTGTGKVEVNGKAFEEYFFAERLRKRIFEPLEAANCVGKFDIIVKIKGGGFSSQADAMRLGIARALLKCDPSLEGVLREVGYLTRDAREKERKKYGLKRARRAFQFSKR